MTPGGAPVRAAIWAWWIRAWLRAYPRRFRRSLAADLVAQYVERQPRGWRAMPAGLAAAARDLCMGGLGARIDDLRASIADLRSARPGRGLASDTRYAARLLLRRPGSSAVMVVTLALAAGLATAVFAVYDATFIRALPYADAGRIVSIGSEWLGSRHASVSIPEYLDYRERASSLAALAAYRSRDVNFTDGPGGPERVVGAQVTASFFHVLGVPAAGGRLFRADEDRPGGPAVAVISHALWQRRFGGLPSTIGSTVRMDDAPVTIVGVVPPSLQFPDRDTDVWLPLRVNPASPGNRGAHNRQVIGRLGPGVSLEAAQDEMTSLAAALGREHPTSYPAGSGWGISVLSLRDLLVGDLQAPLRLLLVAALFVVLVAAVNVAGLTLARAMERGPELATRAALGASRGRIIRQIVVEGCLVGCAGAVAAVAVAASVLSVVEPVMPASIVRPTSVAWGMRASAFALAAGGVAGLVAALAAALLGRVGSPDASAAGVRATAGRRAYGARKVLVVSEVALACILLVGAGLTIASFLRLSSVDPGVSVENVITARVASRASTPDGVVRFFDEVLAALETQPGVRAAGAVTQLPLSGETEDYNFGVEGYVPEAGLDPNAQARTVAGRYFDAMGIPVLEGRVFDAVDSADRASVVIVSAALARRYWPDGRALGRRLKIWSLAHPGPWRTVVGVVGDVRHRGLSQPETPILYLPLAQWPQDRLAIVVRGDAAPPSGGLLERTVRAVDPGQPVYDVRAMAEWRARSMASDRFTLLLLTAFGGTALVLAALGLYGVMALAVAARLPELGVRLALGASASGLMARTVGDGARMTAGGLAIGLVAAAVSARFLTAMLFDVQPVEPVVFAAVPVVVILVAAVSCAVPARRVRRVDPASVLRAR